MRSLHAKRIITIFLLFFFIVPFQVITQVSAKTPVEAFARMPKFANLVVSPDGKYFAAKMELGGIYTVTIFEIQGNELKLTYQARTEDEVGVRWIDWASPTRLLVSLGKAYRRSGTPVTETRLLAINFDGSKPMNMMKRRRSKSGYGGQSFIQIQDRVLDFLPNDPEYVLMAYNEDNIRKPRAYRVNIHNARDSVVQAGRDDVWSWGTDRQGNVRYGYGTKDENWHYMVRDVDNKNWRSLVTGRLGSGKEFTIMGFTNDPNVMVVRSNHENGKNAIYEYDLRVNSFTRKIYGRSDVDVNGVLWNKKNWTVRRVWYILDGVQYKWFDPVGEATYRTIQKSLPGYNIGISDTDANDNVWIVHAGKEYAHGAYFIYDRLKKSIRALPSDYPELDGVRLSKMIRIDYKARDGLTIPAYVSLPNGMTSLAQAKNLPFVIMPHGGPTSRDFLSFDPYVQLFTDRGYGVLQMNFRGSSGYGGAFEEAGNGEWGGKMQDDVTDGVNHIIAKGIANRNRICIVGGSYGGYAALMGAVKTPDLYACAVGFNGVYDLRKMIKDTLYYIDNGSRDYWETKIGGSLSDSAYLDSISPIKRTNEIRIPILVAASDDDRVVRSSQTESMASAMKRSGVTYKHLEMEDGGHSLRTTKSRLAFMKELDSFLAQHLR